MMKPIDRRRGIAMGVAFLVLFVLFATGLVISNLSRGLQRQVEFADASVRAQYIAETGLNLLMARLMGAPYENRWFAGNPDAQAGVEYGGGTYDYFICDTKNRPLFVDIWIRSNYRNSKRFYYWRVKFLNSLLSGLANGMPVNGTEMEGSQFPTTGNDLDRFSANIEAQLERRKKNRTGANTMSDVIQGSNDVTQALNNVGAPPSRGVAGIPFGSDSGDNPNTPLPVIRIPELSANGPTISLNPPLNTTVQVTKTEREMTAVVDDIIKEIDSEGEPQSGWWSGTHEVGPHGVRSHGPHRHGGGPGHGPGTGPSNDGKGPPPDCPPPDEPPPGGNIPERY